MLRGNGNAAAELYAKVNSARTAEVKNRRKKEPASGFAVAEQKIPVISVLSAEAKNHSRNMCANVVTQAKNPLSSVHSAEKSSKALK